MRVKHKINRKIKIKGKEENVSIEVRFIKNKNWLPNTKQNLYIAEVLINNEEFNDEMILHYVNAELLAEKVYEYYLNSKGVKMKNIRKKRKQ